MHYNKLYLFGSTNNMNKSPLNKRFIMLDNDIFLGTETDSRVFLKDFCIIMDATVKGLPHPKLIIINEKQIKEREETYARAKNS